MNNVMKAMVIEKYRELSLKLDDMTMLAIGEKDVLAEMVAAASPVALK